MFPLGFQIDILYNFAKTLLFIPTHAPVDFVFNFSKHFLSSSSQKFRYYLWFIFFPQFYNQSNSNPSILFSKYILNPFTSQHFNITSMSIECRYVVVQWTRASSQGMSLSENLAYVISAILVLNHVFLAEGIFFFLGTRFLARLALKGSPFPNCTKTGYLTPSITLVKLPSFLSQTTIIALRLSSFSLFVSLYNWPNITIRLADKMKL